MKIADIISFAKIKVGEASRFLLQDEGQLTIVAVRAMQRCFFDLGYSFKETFEFTATNEEWESVMPPNVLSPTLVLANGIELEEMTYEEVFKGMNLGRNENPNMNLLDTSPTVSRTVYYFRQSLDGRFIGISPPPSSPVLVQMVYDYVPVLQPNVSAQYTQSSSPIFDEILILSCAIAFLELIGTMDNSKLLAESNVAMLQELSAKMKTESSALQIQQKVMSPLEVFNYLMNITSTLRVRFLGEYKEEKMRVQKELRPKVKDTPYRFPQGILNISRNRSRNKFR